MIAWTHIGFLLAGAIFGAAAWALVTRARIAVLHERLKVQDTQQVAKEDLAREFENLANRIFEQKNEKFGQESKQRIETLITPLREQLGDFKKKVEDVYVKETEGRASLKQEIRQLRELNQQVSTDADNLAKALRGESKTRGSWGELVLERVLEQSGLTKGREYETQVHLHETHGGTRSRYPDVVVHFPDGKDVVIDAKVALNAYIDYCAADDEQRRAHALKAHLDAVRLHIKGLSAKNYAELEGIKSLDLVIMCVPNEAAFIAAVQEDPRLYEDALEQGVWLVGPSTLFGTLRIIEATWRSEAQSRNAQEIARRGELLYKKFAGFVSDMEMLGKRLNDARVAYDAAHGKLTSGKGNLVTQSNELLQLGIKAKKQLPQRSASEENADESEDQPALPSASDAS